MIPESLQAYVQEQERRRAAVSEIQCPVCDATIEEPPTVVRCHQCFSTFPRSNGKRGGQPAPRDGMPGRPASTKGAGR